MQYLEGNIIFHSTAIPLYNGVSQKLVRLYNTAGTDRGQCLIVALLAVLGNGSAYTTVRIFSSYNLVLLYLFF